MKKTFPFFSLTIFIFLFLLSLLKISSDTLSLEIQMPSRTLLCSGDSLHLIAHLSNPDIAVEWLPDDGSILPLSDTSVAVSPTESRWYYATASDSVCQVIDSILIEVQEIVITIDTVPGRCDGEPMVFVAKANVEGEFTWFPGEIENDTLAINTPDSILNIQDTTLFEVQFLSECGLSTAEVVVNVAENPVINVFCFNIGGNPLLVEGSEIDIFVLPNNTEGAEFIWDSGETDPTRTVSPSPPETIYSVTVTYPNGCSRSASKGLVSVPNARIPNAFTPDGNGENDFFNILIFGEYKVKSFEIYNRWGALVYNNQTPATGWDGNFNGQPAASDVYLYQVVLVNFSGDELFYRGDLTLIR